MSALTMSGMSTVYANLFSRRVLAWSAPCSSTPDVAPAAVLGQVEAEVREEVLAVAVRRGHADHRDLLRRGIRDRVCADGHPRSGGGPGDVAGPDGERRALRRETLGDLVSRER